MKQASVAITAAITLTAEERQSRHDRRSLRAAFGLFPTGVAAICGLVDSMPTGIVVSSFTSVSLDPPLVSACVGHGSTTWPKLQSLTKLGISVLAGEQANVASDLSSQSADRFASVNWSHTDDGAVYIDGAPLWIDAEPTQHVTAGDHDIVIFAVQALRSNTALTPLVFHGSRYHNLPIPS